jgi:hypothetical protein
MDIRGAGSRRTDTRESAGTGRGPVLRLAGRGAIALVAAVAAVAAIGPVASAGAAQASATRPSTARPSTARPAAISGGLGSVAATSASNAWAVGATGGNDALIMHWNGASWKQVPAHAPSLSYLNSVAATSASNAWAIGSANSKPLILRWKGSSWARVTVHLPSGSNLISVTATSASSAWIVGSHDASNPRTLILHWNGRSWKQVTSPNPKASSRSGDVLDSVSAVSSKDAWAAGSVDSRYAGPVGGLALRWNGKTWKQVSAKAVTGKASALTGVAATSASSAFAAGCNCAGGIDGAVIGRWNGKTWAKAHLPVPSLGSSLSAVAATSSRSAWAAGAYCKSGCNTEHAYYKGLLLRWNGSSWKLATAPLARNTSLVGVAALSASNAWVVGNSGSGKILILHWNGSSWKLSS